MTTESPATKKPKAKGCLANALLLLVSSAFALGVVETVVRYREAELLMASHPASDPVSTALQNGDVMNAFSWERGEDGLFHVRSENPRLVYELRPNTAINEFIFANNMGFRDHDFEARKSPDTYRIAAVGDSVTFGWFEPPGHTYAKVLEQLLNDNAKPNAPRFEVFNMGIGGYNAAQEAELIATKVLPLEPDLLVVQYCYNDNLIGQDAGLWLHFSSTWWRTWDLARMRWMQWRDWWDEPMLYRSYRRIAELAKDRGIPTVAVLFPNLRIPQDSPARKDFKAFLAELGFTVVDVYPAYSAVGGKFAVHGDDFHPNVLGHRLGAEEIMGALHGVDEAGPAKWLEPMPSQMELARRELGMGLGALRDGDIHAAIRALEAALEAGPGLSMVIAYSLGNTANLWLGEGRVEEAALLAGFAAGASDESPEAWGALGSCRKAQGRHAEALTALEKSIELGDDRFERYFELGEVQLALGQAPEAIATMEKVTELHPTYHATCSAALGKAGKEWLDSGDLDRAIPVFKAAVELEPSNGPGMAGHFDQAGRRFEAAGEYAMAARCFETAADMAPSQTHLLSGAAACYVKARNWEKAASLLEEAFARGHGNRSTLNALDEVYAQLYPGAAERRAAWAELAAKYPENAEMRARVLP